MRKSDAAVYSQTAVDLADIPPHGGVYSRVGLVHAARGEATTGGERRTGWL